MIEEKILDLLEEKFKEEGFSDCFLIDLKLHPGNKLEIFIDSDSGVTFEKCRIISRHLEHHIDESGWMGGKYVLEVSSPGVGRPLKFLRQYPRNIGRKVEVSLREGPTVTGMLVSVDEHSITIEEKVRIKEGKKKKTEIVQTTIPFEEIEKTIVKVTF